VKLLTRNFIIPAFEHCCLGKFFAVLAGKLKRRHSSFRWNDELMALNFRGKFSMPGAMPAHF
jgi:hypothetical protein